MSMVAGLIAIFVAILPEAQSSVGASGNSTAAFNATQRVTNISAELLPLGVLVLAAAAILVGVGILGGT